MTQESMADADTAKFGANAKADASGASNVSDSSNINAPKINVKIGIGKPCAIVIALSRRVYLRQHSFR